jgi:hypothetical protein
MHVKMVRATGQSMQCELARRTRALAKKSGLMLGKVEACELARWTRAPRRWPASQASESGFHWHGAHAYAGELRVYMIHVEWTQLRCWF